MTVKRFKKRTETVTTKGRKTKAARSVRPDNLADTTAGDEATDKDKAGLSTIKNSYSDEQQLWTKFRRFGLGQFEEFGHAVNAEPMLKHILCICMISKL